MSLLAGFKAHVNLHTYTTGCSCQLGTPSLEGRHRSWSCVVCMDQVDHSLGSAEGSRADRESLPVQDKGSHHLDHF